MPAQLIESGARRAAFELGGWTVEPDRNAVSRGDRSVRLEPKVMDVLVCLAGAAGDVVTRRRIIDEVWATEFISDSTLTHAIATLRKVLGDDPARPDFIETIPKRGYRLVASVSGLDRPPDRVAAGPDRRQPMAVIAGDRVHIAEPAADAPLLCLLLHADRQIGLTVPAVVFGRSPEIEIQILAPEVSRRHARIDLDGSGATITDLGSKNGTEVNDELIEGAVALSSGDVIGIGPAVFTFCCLADDPTRTRDQD